MKRRIALNAVKSGINERFSEIVPEENITSSDELLPFFAMDEGKAYRKRKVDSRDSQKVQELVSNHLEYFLTRHPDNTQELFVEVEIENSKELQSYFPEYKTDPIQKEYYFKLERWIKAVQKFSVEGLSVKIQYAEIFKKGYFELFDYLMDEVSSFKTKTKISMLYYYFKEKEFFVSTVTQSEYLEFSRKYGDPPSKIFPKSYKYIDYMTQSLPEKVDFFRKANKDVMN